VDERRRLREAQSRTGRNAGAGQAIRLAQRVARLREPSRRGVIDRK